MKSSLIRQMLMFFTAPAEGEPPAGGSSGEGSGGSETPPTPTPPVTPPADGAEPLGEAGKKALHAERDARKQADKRVADLEAALAAANAEKDAATQTVQSSQAEVEAAKAEALRYKVAAKFGINTEPGEDDAPSDAQMFLTGTTEEELTTQAERLASYRKNSLEDGLFDSTQGGGDRPAPVEPPPGAPRMAAAFDAHITSK